MTQLERLTKEVEEMKLFDATLHDNVNNIITTITDVSASVQVDEKDSKAVKAYKNKRVKRINVILERAKRELNAMFDEDEAEEAEVTEDEITPDNVCEEQGHGGRFSKGGN